MNAFFITSVSQIYMQLTRYTMPFVKISERSPIIVVFGWRVLVGRVVPNALHCIHIKFPLIGSFKMRFLIWEGDEEFPPSAQVLYSDNFVDGFAAEDRVVAGDILITTIKANM